MGSCSSGAKSQNSLNEKIEELVKKYGIEIYSRDNTKLKSYPWLAENEEDRDFVRDHRAEIMAFLKEREQEKERAYQEQQRKIDGIKGLREIREAENAYENYRYEYDRFIANGAIGSWPKEPTAKVAELKKKYPRAAAYMKAEEFKRDYNSAKAVAGEKAQQKIIDGYDFNKAIKEMEKEWDEYCKKHALY